MPDRWTDAELVQFCLDGPFDEISGSQIDALQDRLSESATVRDAVLESPQSADLLERLDIPREQLLPPRQRSPVVGLLLLLCVIVGFGAFFAGTRQVPMPADIRSKPGGTEPASQAPDTADPKPAATDTVTSAAGAGTSATPAAANAVDSATSVQGVTTAETGVASSPENPDVADSPTTEVPWASLLSPDVPAFRIADAVWKSPSQNDLDEFPPDEFRRWFSSIPGRPWQVSDETQRSLKYTIFDGQARLNAPWVTDAVLRLAIYDAERCSLFFWRGNEGIRFRYYNAHSPQQIAAHQVTRTGPKAKPEIGPLIAHDNGRWQRSFLGPFEIRYQNDRLILARGNLPFLNVGFGGPPEEVIVDGKLKVRQCTMYRSDPLPQQQLTRFELPTGQNQLPATQPSHLEWTQPPEGAQSATVQLDSNSGEVALRAGANDTVDAVTVAPIRRTGLAEIVFRVARADPGTGLVLIQDDGTPIFRVGFEWDSNGGRLTVSTQAASTGVVERAFDRNAWPVAWTANDQWLRIVAGAGTTTLWTGEDGKNWSWVGDAATRGETPPITGIGLFALKGADRGITLSHLELREFPTLNSLADPALLRRVNVESFGLPMLLDTGTWMQHVIQSQPEDIDDFTAWRQACAVATLRVGSNKTLAEALLNGLLTENLDNPGIIAGDDGHDQRFLWWMLSEASEVLDLYDTTMGLRFSHVVHESIRRRVLNSLKNQSVSVIATDEPVPDQVAQTDSPDSILPDVSITADGMSEFLMMPFWSQRVELLTPQSAAQLELLSLVQLRQDERVRQLLDRLTFWNSNSHPAQAWWTPLAASYATMAWTELAAHRSLDNEQQVARAWPSRWKTALAPIRHPLAQTVSKEAYNVMAEFQASISGRAFQDACQVISSSATSHMLGLLPDTVDDRLMVSFPNAVSLAMQEYPELRSSMNKQFGTIGRLRVRQAIKNADVDSITAATVQFFGTLAAAESAQWLGDQALAAGQFATARDHYRAALTDYRQNLAVETAEKSALKSRIRITEAILGIPLSSPQTTDAPGTTPPERPLSFGGIEMTAAQFTGLADELRTAGQAKQTAAGIHGVRSVSSAWHVSKSVFPPNGYELQQRFQIQGDAGEHAGKSAAADVNWFSRQNVTEIDGTEAYFSNRFQLTRIDLSTGQEVWRQELGANHGSVNYWPHLAMRPLLTTSRVFCRRLTKTGPHLICCDRVSGKILWTFKPESNSELLVSDPLLIRDRLQIFSQTTNATGPGLIRLLTIDVTHGTVIEDVEVLRMFADSTIPAHLCLATVDDDRIFFSVSGTIACCDSYGHSIWVRRQSWTPVIYDPLRRTRAWQPPLIHGDSVFVSQPGIDGVECLNRSSGRIQWSRMLPGLKRVVGLAGDQLLVERHSGLESLAASDGQSRWQYRATSLMDAVLATLPPDEAVILPDASQPDAVAAAAEPATQWILVTRWRKLPKNIMEARLVWLDQATGRAIAEQPLSLLNSSEVALGPFLTNGDRSWVFGAKNRKEPRQVLYELVKSETRHPTPIIDNSWSAWMPELRDTSLFPPGTYTEPHFTRTAVAPALVEAMRSICPGWILQARPQPGNTGFRPDVHGQQNVLALRLTARTLTKPQLEQAAKNPVDAIRLFRKVTIPNSPSARLRFRVGHEPKQTWKLAIRHEHCQLHSSIIDDETAPDGWQTVNVDMSSYAGSTIQLVITCSADTYPSQNWIYLQGPGDLSP